MIFENLLGFRDICSLLPLGGQSQGHSGKPAAAQVSALPTFLQQR